MVEKIIEWARRSGLDQSDLERRADLPKGRISKWKNGQGGPSGAQAVRIARELGVTVEMLFDERVDDARVRHTAPELTPDEMFILRTVRALGLDADEVIRRIHDGAEVTVEAVSRPKPPEAARPEPRKGVG